MSPKKAIQQPTGKRTGAKKQALRAPDAPLMPAYDRRAMEKTMADITRLLNEHDFESIEEANAFLQDMLASGTTPSAPAQTPLEEAQDVMYEAWSAKGANRVKLARKALRISPDCADAYVLLAEETARSAEEARVLYELGVRAGQRALGPETFQEDAGNFWGILETRPYMRARAGLARTLWWLGRRRETIEHLSDMLRLNPGDNQGLRYFLSMCLLETGDNDALEMLVNEYKVDDSASWLYTRALMLFRKEGARAKSSRALQKALRANPYVPLYLLGRKRLPKQMPQYVGLGDENEAIDCAAGMMKAWKATPGALDWLASGLGG